MSAKQPVLPTEFLFLPDILAHLRQLAQGRLQADILLSCQTLRELRDDVATPPAERRKCAEVLLDRAGWVVAGLNVTANVDVTETREAMIEEILTFAKRSGIDARLLVGGAAAFVNQGTPRRQPVTIEADTADDPDDAEVWASEP
jgi:hypothetical protein